MNNIKLNDWVYVQQSIFGNLPNYTGIASIIGLNYNVEDILPIVGVKWLSINTIDGKYLDHIYPSNIRELTARDCESRLDTGERCIAYIDEYNACIRKEPDEGDWENFDTFGWGIASFDAPTPTELEMFKEYCNNHHITIIPMEVFNKFCVEDDGEWPWERPIKDNVPVKEML
jgi:hypothetical protein